MEIVELIKGLLEVLREYIQYIYPGFISLWIYYFLNAKNFKENINTIIKSVVISYIMIQIVRFIDVLFYNVIVNFYSFSFLKLDLLGGVNSWSYYWNNWKIKKYDYFFLLILSIICPYIFFRLTNNIKVLKMIKRLKINTFTKDSMIDNVRSTVSRKKLFVSVYLDEVGLRYDGWLLFNQSDKEDEEVICLNCYRRYYKTEDLELKSANYIYLENLDTNIDENGEVSENEGHRNIVILKEKDITRIEILLEESPQI